jgi:plasmid stabilization system protein ParE
LADVREIRDFISRDNPQAADRVLDELYEAFVMLGRTPGAGHVRRDLTSRDVLFWPVRSYLIVYVAPGSPLTVVAVLHGRRNVRKLLRNRLP